MNPRYRDCAFYAAWENQNLPVIRELWIHHPQKRCPGVKIMLDAFLETHSKLSTCVDCLLFFWNAGGRASKVSRRNVLRRHLAAFRASPRFGSLSHYLFLESLHLRGIINVDFDERELHRGRAVLLALRSAALPRLGARSHGGLLPPELLRCAKVMLGWV